MTVGPRRIHTLTVLLILFCALVSFAGPGPSADAKFRWPKGKIVVSLSTSLFRSNMSIPQGLDVKSSLARAMSKWESAADLEFELQSTEIANVSESGAAGDGVSLITIEPSQENLQLFTKQNANASAITRLFFNKRNEITEADIVLNPRIQFSSDGIPGTFDLEKVLTHELGHLLGLRHAIFPTSVMSDEVPRNLFLDSYGREFQLSADDINSVRSIYGPPLEESDCCGSLTGIIKGGNFRTGQLVLVDRSNGTVVLGVATDRNGTFAASGLAFGTYDIWYSLNVNAGRQFEDRNIGSVRIVGHTPKALQSEIQLRIADAGIQMIGSNGSLSKQAVRVVRGEKSKIWIAGNGLGSAGNVFGTSSAEIGVSLGKDISDDFASSMEVFIAEITVSENAVPGMYSLFVQSKKGRRTHLFGALEVE